MTRRLIFISKWVVICVVTVASLLWLYLYLNSVHQRRKAERFLSELTALPIDADFAQVRELTIRFGGTPIHTNAETGHDECTTRNCIFEIEIRTAEAKLFQRDAQFLRLVGAAASHLGIRPWVVTASLAVKDGVLQHSTTTVSQERVASLGDYAGPILIIYSVDIDRTATLFSDSGFADRDFVVVRPNVTGAPTEPLHTWAVQTPSGKWKRALDLHLECLTTISTGCSDFRQLAPSAWEHHEQARN